MFPLFSECKDGAMSILSIDDIKKASKTESDLSFDKKFKDKIVTVIIYSFIWRPVCKNTTYFSDLHLFHLVIISTKGKF